MNLRALVRFLVPSHQHFYELVERQARAVRGASDALALGSLAETAELERSSEKLVLDMEVALEATFVAPVDRDDLQKLSSELHRTVVCINASNAAIETPSPAVKQLTVMIGNAVSAVEQGIGALRTSNYDDVARFRREIRTIDKAAARVSTDEISRVLRDGAGAREMIRDKDLLDVLDRAIEQCNVVGAVLGHLAVKNG